MLAATWVKMSDSGKKVNKNTYDISSIKRVTRKLLEVSRCSRAKQRQRNVQRKCAARAKVAFLLIRPIFVFSQFSLPSPLSITRFYILFEQTINIIGSFAFSPGYIYILFPLPSNSPRSLCKSDLAQFFSRFFRGELSVKESLCLASCPVTVRRLPSPSRSTDSDDVSKTNSQTRS